MKRAKQPKGMIYKVLTVLAIVLAVAMLLQWQPVAEQVAKVTGVAVDKLKAGAKAIVMPVIALILIAVGVAVISLPVLAVTLIGVGLVMLAISVWPLFQSKPAGMEASFDSKKPLKVFG